MRVTVGYYGFLKSLPGADQNDFDLDVDETMVGDVVARAAMRLGMPPERLDFTAAAVNDELVDRSHHLREGDVVMLLPPVSGG